MKRILVCTISIFLILLAVNIVRAEETVVVENSPWVYPATISNPTLTSYYVVPLTSGPNTYNLILWNHHPNYDFAAGKFVIAIKSGFGQVTINSVTINGVSVAVDTTGTTRPGPGPGESDYMPWDGIFPCPWIQYDVGNTLIKRQNPNGWQGSGDYSGVSVVVDVTVTGSASDVKLYFLSWGYDQMAKGNQFVWSPYSHITETSSPPDHVIPEVPLGPVMATASMIAAFGAYFGIRRRNFR